MKRKIFLSLITAMMFSLTSCQYIDQAVEETFRKYPEKLIKDEESEQDLLEKIKSALFDKSNQTIFPQDIISDAEDKMGFEFSIVLSNYFESYLFKNEISRYLSNEEIESILKSYKDNNLLLNNELLKDLKNDLIDQVGADDFHIYKTGLTVCDNSLYAYVIDPEKPENVDLYYYNLSIGDWEIMPQKIGADTNPMNNSFLLSQINFDSYKKMVDTSLEILMEMDDFEEAHLWDRNFGINYIYTQFKGEDLVFKTSFKGSREDYDLTFDIDGNLIEKERK